ncbi:MAG: hypothetical protein ACI9O4_002462 [Chitinophagales bacterium]|jgi:hypothetical protein
MRGNVLTTIPVAAVAIPNVWVAVGGLARFRPGYAAPRPGQCLAVMEQGGNQGPMAPRFQGVTNSQREIM